MRLFFFLVTHIDGNPAHLHTNGICPYSNNSSLNSSSSNNTYSFSQPLVSSVTPSNSQQNNDTALKIKYKAYIDDYNNKVTYGYFRQDVNDMVSQFISNPDNTSYINSLLTADESTDLLSGSSSTVKYDILSKILYSRVYEIMLQQTNPQNKSEQQTDTNNISEQNSINQDEFIYNLVVQLQTQLTALGYYAGSINGIFDIETQQSLINFQNAFGLTPDGTINQQVVDTLGIHM